jgi:hypothetical protein
MGHDVETVASTITDSGKDLKRGDPEASGHDGFPSISSNLKCKVYRINNPSLSEKEEGPFGSCALIGGEGRQCTAPTKEVVFQVWVSGSDLGPRVRRASDH